MKCVAFTCLVFFLVISLPVPGCTAPSADQIPQALDAWRSWVLYGHEKDLCPMQYNDGAVTRCQWPARINIDVTAEGGRFEQGWLIFAPSWVELPGSQEVWPDTVDIDGRSVAVIQRGEKPMVELLPGEHRITGRFFWPHMPEMIQIPSSLGLLSLSIEGRTVTAPLMDAQGRLWLQKSTAAGDDKDRLDVKVFRLLNDTIPMQVQTVLRLDISGKGREITLKNVLPATCVPMDLESRLPARIDRDGQLSVQARAGRWEIMITSRIPGQVTKIGMEAMPYGEEIWSFQPQHELRMVEIEGVHPVEPGQTEMPSQWRGYSAYLVKPGDGMIFRQIRRGDAEPAPDRLSLNRIWWLDFNGKGFTIHDRVQGTLSRQWFLAADEPLALGRVAVDGQDRVITRQGTDNKAGVELRRGALDLKADARLSQRTGRIPTLGWDHDFQQVAGVLNLPPGWKLFAATGVDQASDTWLQSWSLLDFFLVLIVALAFFKLRTWRWALVALAAMTLIYHEPGAPRLVWLHILVVLALLPLLPAGWFRRLLILWGVAAGVFLVATVVPFMVHQIRWGMYPQLAPQDRSGSGGYYAKPAFESENMAQPQSVEMDKELAPSQAPMSRMKGKVSSLTDQQSLQEEQRRAGWSQDPDASIPTGPGLPDWQWQTIALTWNGPMAKDQTMRLVLFSPLFNLFLAFVRVGLLAAMIWSLFDWRPWWRKLRNHLQPVGLALLGGLIFLAGPHGVQAAESTAGFPPPALLEELKQRLLEKPDCLPYCADISRLEVVVSDDDVQMMLKVHAAEKTALPLPVNSKSWNPDQILLDNAPISGLLRDTTGQLWAMAPQGLHTIVLLGRAGNDGLIQIPLPLRPHAAVVTAKGWTVKGLLPDGRAGSSIELARLQQEDGDAKSAAGQRNHALPSFLHVERRLELGLTWLTTTTVRRLTPLGTPVVAELPLLENESVTTAGVQVDQGHVLINLSADQQTITYTSTLTIAPDIILTAPKTVPWTETWVLDAGPIWHCELEGIPVIRHQDEAGGWQPQWQPWPGEQVTIHVQRPQAIPGQLLTIDGAALVLTPGQRFGKGELSLQIRTSRGGQHTVQLPPKANLQQVTINGTEKPIRQDGANVTIPLQPGNQTVNLQWQQLAPFSAWFKAPEVKIDQQAVNAHVTINMPPNRWILLVGGPRWGPAILFWSYFAVIILAALALSRMPLTPLKTRQWLLLGLGLTQVSAVTALIIVGWLLVLGLRERRDMPAHWAPYNGIQLGLVVWTVAALVCLYAAVEAGLIGQPEMQVVGNQSYAELLNWTQDHIDGSMPRPWVFSLPVLVFKFIMLIWSLWLAVSLLRWLKWGWGCFSKDGLWRKIRRSTSEKTAAAPLQTPSEG